MPRGDRTGPLGFGPMTGRGAGFCAGYDTPGYLNAYGGRSGAGFGRGMGYNAFRPMPGMGGRGRGRMNMYYATGIPGWARYGYAPITQPYIPPASKPSPDEEMEYLKELAVNLKSQMEWVEERIKAIKSEIKTKNEK